MVAKPSRRATYQDVLAAPPNTVAEVLFGVLYTNPRPAPPHELDILVPDLAAWRRERLPAVPAKAFLTLAADWVCEVLSPRTNKIDRSDKMTIYLREGVRHVWLLDPIECMLEIYRHAEKAWLRVAVHRDDAVVRAEPFDAIELALAGLWVTPEPPEP
jgi:Uma2 family endonuclease